MEIRVGEYIRTKDGRIVKLENNKEFHEDSIDVGIGVIPAVDGIWIDNKHIDYIEKKDIAKHSFNIIDLIEEGDFVNDKKVKINYKDAILFEDGENIVEQQIKSIVTKEMFQNVEYRVESN